MISIKTNMTQSVSKYRYNQKNYKVFFEIDLSVSSFVFNGNFQDRSDESVGSYLNPFEIFHRFWPSKLVSNIDENVLGVTSIFFPGY